MPVTAKLSRRFYEQLGDEIANELVDWFNSVDATYRSDLRELNELNFARFDAKVEQRFAEQDARWERRFAGLEAKVDQCARKADLAELRVQLAQLREDVSTQLARFSEEITSRLSASEVRIFRWMFTLWTGTMVTLAGLLLAILRSR